MAEHDETTGVAAQDPLEAVAQRRARRDCCERRAEQVALGLIAGGHRAPRRPATTAVMADPRRSRLFGASGARRESWRRRPSRFEPVDAMCPRANSTQILGGSVVEADAQRAVRRPTSHAVVALTPPVNGLSWLWPDRQPFGRNGGVSEPATASVQQTRQQLLNVVDRLVAEFPDRPAGVMIAQVVLAKEHHRWTDDRGRRELVAVVEHVARERMQSAQSESSG